MMIKTFHSTFALVAAAALLSSPMTVNAGTFDSGNDEGKQKAEHIWSSKDWSNCSNISKFEKQVTDYINNYYSNPYNDNFLNKGAQAGMHSVLKKYQEQCKNDDHDDSHMNVQECDELGENVASEIAETYAATYCDYSSNGLNPGAQRPTLYKEQCFNIGVEDCKGLMNKKIYHYCGHYIDGPDAYDTLINLENQCPGKVSNHIYNNGSGSGSGSSNYGGSNKPNLRGPNYYYYNRI
jgi:hypothetical protein